MTDHRWPQSEYLVNHRHRFVLCPIPKVASSSLKQWFISTLDAADLPDDASDRPHLALAEWSRGQEMANIDGYRFVAFVREPARRLVSAYLQKVVVRWNVPESPGRAIVQQVQQRLAHETDYERGITFREFVTAICKRPQAGMDVHWRPQNTFLPIGFPRANVDLLGRVENFEVDLTRINESLGLQTTAEFNALRLDYQEDFVSDAADWSAQRLRERGAFPAWRSFLDDALIARICDFYAADYEAFGYTMPTVEPTMANVD